MKRFLLAVGATAAALALAACGSDSTGHDMSQHSGSMATTAAPAADHVVAADVTFLQGMIPHHRGAIEMADLAPTRAQSPQVKGLAAKIKSAQDSEITQMTGWLNQWGEPEMSMDHSGHDMSHMAGMNPDDMAELTAAKGADFDRMFLTMMISHHQAAIDMAKTEQTSGQYQPAMDLAGRIITAQQAEITQMQDLLKAV